jgi:hypothetical protein
MIMMLLRAIPGIILPLASLLSTDPTGIDAALLRIAGLAAGFIGGTLAVVLVVEGYQYMFSDSASRGVHLKRLIALVIGGAVLVILGVGLAQPIVSAITGQ